jgi:hypothetical protein
MKKPERQVASEVLDMLFNDYEGSGIDPRSKNGLAFLASLLTLVGYRSHEIW